MVNNAGVCTARTACAVSLPTLRNSGDSKALSMRISWLDSFQAASKDPDRPSLPLTQKVYANPNSSIEIEDDFNREASENLGLPGSWPVDGTHVFGSLQSHDVIDVSETYTSIPDPRTILRFNAMDTGFTKSSSRLHTSPVTIPRITAWRTSHSTSAERQLVWVILSRDEPHSSY